MAQQTVSSRTGESESGNGEAGLSGPEKQLPVALKKTPLRDLQSENNIATQKAPTNPLLLKEAVNTEAAKISGTKRPSSDSTMSSHQHSPSGNGGSGHLVYVRRKTEAEAGKNSNNEVVSDSTISPQPRQLGHQADGHQTKSLMKESHHQCLPAYAPISTTSLMSIPSGKPSIPVSLGNPNYKTFSEETRTQPVPSAINLSAQPRANKQNWEERYLQLQKFLKSVDQSSLEDHLQTLRSLSAVELSRHAVELEKRAIQLSLEQGKEMQRVKGLNVLGKSQWTTSSTTNATKLTRPSYIISLPNHDIAGRAIDTLFGFPW